MPALRQPLKRPRTWLLAIATFVIVVVGDTFLPAEFQASGFLYVRAVRVYQWGGRPLLKGKVQCRFEPTCSNYSIEAVETHGIRDGLLLTTKRLCSCTRGTPLGTKDPVPPKD
jgi:putative membrane protein insertion efficiency factor